MMQTSQHRFREHERTRRQSMSGFGLREQCQFPRRIRYARPQRAVTTSSVVMGDPLFQNGTKMCLRHRNQPIQAFAPNRPDHALADRICFRTRHGRSQHLQAQCPDRIIEVLGEYPIAIMDQVPMGCLRPRRPPAIAAASSPQSDWPSHSHAPGDASRAR